MKKIIGFNGRLATLAVIALFGFCNFSGAFAMTPAQLASQRAAQGLGEAQALEQQSADVWKQKARAGVEESAARFEAAQRIAQQKQQAGLAKTSFAKTDLGGLIGGEKSADKALQARKDTDEMAALKVQMAEEKQKAEEQRKEMEAQLAAKDKALADAQAAHEQALVDQKAFEEWKAMSAEDKIKEILTAEGQRIIGEQASKVGSNLKEIAKQAGIWDKLPSEVQNKISDEVSKGGIRALRGMGLGTVHQKTVGALSGVGAVGAGGAGLAVTMTDQPKQGAGAGAGGEGAAGAAGAQGGASAEAASKVEGAGSGQTVVAGMMLDLSKLTMPSLQAKPEDLAALKKVIIASKPIANLSDQLLKVVTTSIIIKVQDSFNVAFAALKASKEFNLDGTVEQINAKILQDCKDLKAFIVNLGALACDVKRKLASLSDIKTTMGSIGTKIKDNFTTMFTTDMVAQFVTLQQKVTKADLKTLMGRVNTTVQGTIDQASDELDAAIEKRKAALAKQASTAAGESEKPAEETQAGNVNKPQSTQPASESSAAWHEMVNG